MDRSVFVITRAAWLNSTANAKRLAQGLFPVGTNIGHFIDGCSVFVKIRLPDGELALDVDAKIRNIAGAYFIKSRALCDSVARAQEKGWLSFFMEGTENQARCIVRALDQDFFEQLASSDPAIRLEAFDLPPSSATLVDSDTLISKLYRRIGAADPELFEVQASRFLDAPHILSALLNHVFLMRAEDNIQFPIKVKTLAEQMRVLLSDQRSSMKIRTIAKSHLNLWSEVEGRRFGFLDGGVARIAPFSGGGPAGLRVGVYSVRPGINEPEEREQWRMTPFVLGDLIDRGRPTEDRPDIRRFQEAARYALEPLTAVRHLREFPDTQALFLHGPLVTQFVQYDEVEPNYIPFISPEFLARAEITEASVMSTLHEIPLDSAGVPRWNHFMAVYGYILAQIERSTIPVAGVVERPTGRAVALAMLHQLRDDSVVTAAYVDMVKGELDKYDVTDEFLFGCMLREGEYISPVTLRKSPEHRARPHWQPVVRQYLRPKAVLLKTEEMNFPFRVEMNSAAAASLDFIMRFLYHTARLLPRYAFPVGLDIVDKYAKVPDWIARGVSCQMSALILRRALKTGDARLVTQIRLLLASGPRDFFYRPSARI